MSNDRLKDWIDAGVALADEQIEVREFMKEVFGFMHGCSGDYEATRELSPVLGEATDRILAMLGPLSPPGSCLCCRNPVSEGGCQLCEECQGDHGDDPGRWPAWIRRIADDRAARVAAAA